MLQFRLVGELDRDGIADAVELVGRAGRDIENDAAEVGMVAGTDGRICRGFGLGELREQDIEDSQHHERDGVP